MSTFDDTTPSGPVIRYWPGPTAQKAHRSRARVKYAWGPFRSAKSTWLCWRFFYLCERVAKLGLSLRGIILRDTYRNLKDTTLKTWDEWFGSLSETIEAEPRTIRLHIPDSPITHELLFRHGQNAAEASNFLSSEYGFIGLEEICPAFTPSGLISPGISEEVFDMALGRLVQKGIEEPELSMTSNPPPVQHWASKRLIDVSSSKLADLNWAHFWFPPEENKMNIRPGFYEELMKAWPEELVRRFVKGERVAVYPGLPVFAKDFSERLHVRDDLKPTPSLPLTLCADTSGLAPAALITQIDHKGRWLWLHELQGGYIDGRLVEQIGAERFSEECKLLALREFPGFKFNRGYGDPFRLKAKSDTDEKTWQQFFRAAGFELDPGATSIVERTETVRRRLNHNIEGSPAILINRQGCPMTIQALQGGYRYGLDPTASRVMGTEPLKNEFSNLMDAAGHAAPKLFPISMMIPRAPYRPHLAPSAMAS